MGEIEIVESARLPAIRPAVPSPALVYLARLGSPASRRTQAAALRVIANLIAAGSSIETFTWHQLRYEHTQAIRSRLAELYAPATANARLAALRGVLREAWRLGLMDAEEYRRACDLAPVRGSRLPKGRALGRTEMSALFATCGSDDHAALRDAGLLAVLYSAGLRRSEAVGLDLGDYDTSRHALRVQGKGNKERLCYLGDFAVDRLGSWLELRGLEEGPLFVRLYKGGRLSSDRLTAQAVRYILQQRCEQASVTPASPHDFRRTFISDLLDAQVDISTVQQMAGHSSVTTTQRYDRRGDDAKMRAAQQLRVP